MAERSQPVAEPAVIDRAGLARLVELLAEQGRTVLGPRLADGAITFGPLGSADDLPAGWIDEQDGGHYRLVPGGGALFGYVVGPDGAKRRLFPPVERLWRARRSADGFTVEPEPVPAPSLAMIGLRPCDLAAMQVQDRVFAAGPFGDPGYRARRDALFVVAVNCSRSAATCFCASMGTGPRAGDGFDLALTERAEGDRHEFLVEAGSEAGAALLAALPQRPAAAEDLAAAEAATARAAAAQRRTMVPEVAALLSRHAEHPRWDDVARRCLTCGNCTQVCPTCFCTTVEDATDLSGETAERRRRWDSCFTLDFSYVHGGTIRREARSRYRQWITHKLSAWHDQFGVSGCVGCGRCITWCPVGIDITEEAGAIAASDQGSV